MIPTILNIREEPLLHLLQQGTSFPLILRNLFSAGFGDDGGYEQLQDVKVVCILIPTYHEG